MIYNMTTHVCDNDRVETQPRLPLLANQSDKSEILENVYAAFEGIPKGSDVLVGGHPNYIMMVQQLAKSLRLRLWLYDSRRGAPYSATFANRVDRYMIETRLANDS